MTEVPSKPNPVEICLTVFDHGIAAQERQLLALGIPISLLARILAQHSASILALISQPTMRADAIKEIISNYPQMVRRAQLAAATTPGGVILPKAREDALAETDAPPP